MVNVRLAQAREDGKAQIIEMEVTFDTGTNHATLVFGSLNPGLLGPKRRS